jgi:hypothetical protein
MRVLDIEVATGLEKKAHFAAKTTRNALKSP